MVNKRGWLRIVEALVSILIVFGAVLTVATTHRPVSEQDFCSALPPLLEEIAQNADFRTDVINGRTERIGTFLSSHILNPSITYQVRICDPSVACTHSESGLTNVDICAEERIIASTTEQFKIQKLKIFLFRKK